MSSGRKENPGSRVVAVQAPEPLSRGDGTRFPDLIPAVQEDRDRLSGNESCQILGADASRPKGRRFCVISEELLTGFNPGGKIYDKAEVPCAYEPPPQLEQGCGLSCAWRSGQDDATTAAHLFV